MMQDTDPPRVRTPAVVLAAREDRSKNHLKGYLRKKSSKGSWQRRWFEASAHYLTYYKTAESDKILACIDIVRVGEIKLVPGVVATGGPYEFSLQLDERVYLMKAKTLRDANRWVEGLNAIKARCKEAAGTHSRDVKLSVGSGGGRAAGGGAGAGAGAGAGSHASKPTPASSRGTLEVAGNDVRQCTRRITAAVEKASGRDKTRCLCCGC